MFQSKPQSPQDRLFDTARRQLNAAQTEAVAHVEGPMLVVAGPGTGKTQLLAMRIGAILTETDTQPHNILCLTFTDAAVRAMRERLLQLIGADAHKVRIFTFHAFCNRVIQDNLDLFGRQDLSPLDELERRQMLRDLLDELAAEHPLRRGRGSDAYFYEKHLADLFRLMKTEAWTTRSVVLAVDDYLSNISQNIDFQYQITKKGLFTKGDLKHEAIAEETERMERLKAAAQLYPRFEALKRTAQRYDFDDMILWVSDAFEKMPFLLRGLQEQFLYFLVDEFQDTNGAQNRILGQLIDFWQQPNVFIVGDDDQAIYEFQGARLRSLVEFYEAYRKDVRLVVLSENYRSSQRILDAAKRLIDRNELRILNSLEAKDSSKGSISGSNSANGLASLSKNLMAKGEFANAEIDPKIVEYAARPHEIADVIAQIEEIFSSQPSALSRQPSIAIIFSRHRTAEAYLRLLDKKQIPYTVRRAVNILDEPLIQNLRLLLTYIAAESRQPFSGDYLVFKLLTINFLQINPKDLLSLTAHVGKQNVGEVLNLADVSEFEYDFYSKNTPSVFRSILANLPPIIFLEKDKLTRLSNQIENWIAAVQNAPLTVLIEKIINQSGLLAWILNGNDKIKNTQIANTFVEFVRREVEKKPRLTLADLLKTLDLMDANNLRLEWVRQDLNSNVNAQNSKNTEGVFLTTAHGAKGLEFDYVFVVDAIETEWEDAKTSSINRFKLPPTLTFTAEADAMEARRRLFYVAVTRARLHLQVSFSKTDALGKPLNMSQFVSELNVFPIEKRSISANEILDNQILQLSTVDSELILPAEFLENAYIADTLRDFQITISSLNAYLDCPLSFYFEYLLNIPSEPSPAYQYGSAVHFALRRLFNEMLRTKDKSFPPIDDFIQYFEVDFSRRKQFFELTDFDNRMRLGKANLIKFYSQFADIFSKNAIVERTISAHINGVPARGVLDKIEFRTDGSAHIVDYKTGKPNDADTRRPTAKNPIGGAYWRQLVFYKLLYENYRANLVRVTTGEILHVEADVRGNFKSKTMDLTTKDGEILRGLITDVWSKIQQRNFTGCGKKGCKWCGFIRNNYATDSFRNEKLESLDD